MEIVPTSEAISLTPEAQKQAQQLKDESSEFVNMHLRLYIEGKNCDGFVYGVCFDNSQNEDLLFENKSCNLIVDPQTYLFTKGSIIEWVNDERGKGFIVNNPNHKKYRGKFFKREAWQKFLSKE